VLPAFGIFSEVVSTFSGKPPVWLSLHGRRDDGDLCAVIRCLGCTTSSPWEPARIVQRLSSGSMTMIIAVPTGVKVFQLAVHDVWRPHPGFTVPILWSIGFMVTFVDRRHGPGVLMAVPPADFQLHTTACS